MAKACGVSDFIGQLLELPDPRSRAIHELLLGIGVVELRLERIPSEVEPVLAVVDRRTSLELMRFTIRGHPESAFALFQKGENQVRIRFPAASHDLTRLLGFEIPPEKLGMTEPSNVNAWLVADRRNPRRLAAWLNWTSASLS